MNLFTRALGAVALFFLASTALSAQGDDLTGVWDITSSTLLPDANEACEHEGSADLVQSNGMLSGDVTLSLVSGPVECPDKMTADLTGDVENGTIAGVLDGAELGAASFSGDVDPSGMSISGNTDVEQGPFAGSTSSWTAQLAPPAPTLNPLTLALLALLLFTAATYVVLRHRRA